MSGRAAALEYEELASSLPAGFESLSLSRSGMKDGGCKPEITRWAVADLRPDS